MLSFTTIKVNIYPKIQFLSIVFLSLCSHQLLQVHCFPPRLYGYGFNFHGDKHSNNETKGNRLLKKNG